MSGRLTHGEIRIIEETKRQGEELYGAGKAADGGVGKDDSGKTVQKSRSKSRSRSKTGSKAPIVSVIIFAVIFILLALVVHLFVAWLAY